MGKKKKCPGASLVICYNPRATDGRNYFVKNLETRKFCGAGNTPSDLVRILDKNGYKYSIDPSALQKLLEKSTGGKLVKLVLDLPVIGLTKPF